MSEFITYLLYGVVTLLFLVFSARFSITCWRMNKIQRKSGWNFLAVSAAEPILTFIIAVVGYALISAVTFFDPSDDLVSLLFILGVLGLFAWLSCVTLFILFGIVKHKMPLLFVTSTLRIVSVYTAPIFAFITLFMMFVSEKWFGVFFVTSIITACIALILLPLHFIYLWYQARKAKKWMAEAEQKKLGFIEVKTL